MDQKSQKKSLWVALLVAALLAAIAYALLFWSPGDGVIEQEPQVIPPPAAAPE